MTRITFKNGNLLVIAAIFALLANPGAGQSDSPYRSWPAFGGGPEAMKYSALDQVNRENVRQLKPIWTYRMPATADAGKKKAGGGGSVQSNPVVIGDRMFILAPNNTVIALNAATGGQLWLHRSSSQGTATRRGLVYWESPDAADQRIFFTVGPNLIALKAADGQPIPSFGNNGTVTMTIDFNSTRTVGAPSPGIIFDDLLIMGSVVGEMWNGAPGNIRAYDVRTGELRWVFRTIPHPGEFGYDTWPPDSYLGRNGGANVWGAFSVDHQRGLVFAPTGSPAYDFYGADRKGANLFGNCVIALDARTGERRWHYQTVHHDLWDYDLSAQPLLCTIDYEGRRRDVVIQVTKHGFIFVLDRDTGEPVYPVEERPVPQSDLPGEETWPTQPFPLKPAPVSRQHVTIDDLTDLPDADEREELRAKFLGARNEGLFTPGSTRGTIVSPGHNGGPLWGGGAFNPETQMLYVSAHDQPSYFLMSQRNSRINDSSPPLARGRQIYRNNCALCHGPAGDGVMEVLGPLMANSSNSATAENPALSAVMDRTTLTSFTTVVRHGKNRMPPSPQLTDDEVRLLYDYVRQIKSPETQAAADSTEGEGEVQYTTPWTFFRDSRQLPIVKPPWGRMTAIDMKTGDTKWVSLVGNEDFVAERGLPQSGHKYLKGGPVVTAGGLVFMAGTNDRRIRAYNAEDGELLWEGELPHHSASIPAVYELNGKQFIAIPAMAPGDAVVAFALP